MKSTFAIVLISLLCPVFTSAQVIQYRDLIFNDIAFRVNTDGSIFENSAQGGSGCRIPASGTSTSIFAANPWFGGILSNGDTATLVGTYNKEGQEYVPGPASTSFDQEYFSIYYKTWIMTIEEVNYHRAHYLDSNYQMDDDIRNWPGNGREGKEKSGMAPYEDVNGNFTYDPENGDYPSIPGDMNLFYMKNSLSNQAANTTGGKKLKLQVNGFLYTFNSIYAPLNTTLFHKLIVINLGQEVITDFHAGMWIDIDLGDNLDDYSGTIPGKNAIYNYNSDNFDNLGKAPYGQSPPVQGFIWLNETMTAGTIYDYKTEPGKQYAPYYNYLSGKTFDGQNDPAFDYPGDPLQYDTTAELGLATEPGDRRVVSSITHGTFLPGQVLCLDGAYVWSRGGDNNLSNITAFYQDIDFVHSFYQQTLNGQCFRYAAGLDELSNPKELFIYPNPTASIIHLEMKKPDASAIEICDLSGRTVLRSAFSGQISIGEISPGVYLIKVLDKAGNTIANERFIRSAE